MHHRDEQIVRSTCSKTMSWNSRLLKRPVSGRGISPTTPSLDRGQALSQPRCETEVRSSRIPLRTMLRSLALLNIAFGLQLQAQLMELNGGSMHVAGGTRLFIDGATTWRLGSDVLLLNDGVIEFGPSATLEEAPGAPINGSGIETTTRVINTTGVGTEPAGLGLTLDPEVALGPITLVRGHVPFTLPNGGTSISRWFSLETNDLDGSLLEATLRYDPSELNGLSPGTLDLYTSVDPDDFWTPRSGEAYLTPPSVVASSFWPWTYMTAFEADATTAVIELTSGGFRAWPTATTGLVYLESTGHGGVDRWEVRDASGRLHAGMNMGLPGPTYHTLDLSFLAGGIYFLRVNDSVVIKLLKE